jgi:TolA-binding protein
MNIIYSLSRQHGDQLQLDRLYFHKGRGIFIIGEKASEKVNLSYDGLKPDEEYCRKVLEYFVKAQDAFKQSLFANPRGEYAASNLYQLGKVAYTRGTLALKMAEKFNDVGDKINARLYQELGQKSLKEAPGYLRQIAGLETTKELSLNSRYLLGLCFISIDRYANAETVFRNLLNESLVPYNIRINSATELAKLLRRLGRSEEAIGLLMPYLKSRLSRESALLCGELYEDINHPQKAIETYLKINDFPPPSNQKERITTAKTWFKAYSLSLKMSRSASYAYKKGELLKLAVEGLTETARKFSETPSASKALTVLGDYYLSKNNFSNALKLVEEGKKLFHTPEASQEMLLLSGRVLSSKARTLLQTGQRYRGYELMDEAMAEFRKAETTKVTSPQGKLLRAQSILELARAFRDKDNPTQAVAKYSYIFAHYPDETVLADIARIEASEILRKTGQYDAAIAILKDANELNKIQPIISRLEEEKGMAKQK